MPRGQPVSPLTSCVLPPLHRCLTHETPVDTKSRFSTQSGLSSPSCSTEPLPPPSGNPCCQTPAQLRRSLQPPSSVIEGHSRLHNDGNGMVHIF